MKDLVTYINESSKLSEWILKFEYWVQKNLDIKPFLDILGDYDESFVDIDHVQMACGSGDYGETKNVLLWYMSAGWSGDYIPFKNKPSKAQLNKCTELLKKTLKKKGFGDVDLEFIIKEHNSYYQPPNTYGIGVNVYIPSRK